jgi:hypothetical protein
MSPPPPPSSSYSYIHSLGALHLSLFRFLFHSVASSFHRSFSIFLFSFDIVFLIYLASFFPLSHKLLLVTSSFSLLIVLLILSFSLSLHLSLYIVSSFPRLLSFSLFRLHLFSIFLSLSLPPCLIFLSVASYFSTRFCHSFLSITTSFSLSLPLPLSSCFCHNLIYHFIFLSFASSFSLSFTVLLLLFISLGGLQLAIYWQHHKRFIFNFLQIKKQFHNQLRNLKTQNCKRRNDNE